MNMATERKDNSDAWAKMKTMEEDDKKSVKSAANSGNVAEFKSILINIKFPTDLIVDMDEFMLSCKHLTTQNGKTQTKQIKKYAISQHSILFCILLFLFLNCFVFFCLTHICCCYLI